MDFYPTAKSSLAVLKAKNHTTPNPVTIHLAVITATYALRNSTLVMTVF